jgi:hypothetical protein
LVAHGDGALDWCAGAIEHHDLAVVEDAAGVLAWLGVPCRSAVQMSGEPIPRPARMNGGWVLFD